MKLPFRKITAALGLAAILLLSSCTQKQETRDEGITAVASFYPIYIIAENVIGDAEGITLENMARPQTGCLHNYQLSTGDMKKLSTADIFIINGGGMESFLDNALSLFPKLNIVDSSEGTASLEEEHDEHEEHKGHDGHEGHDHEENSHFWMLPENAVIQAENICSALCELSPENADIFKENTRRFAEEVTACETFDGDGIKACVFNEAFEYLSLSYGMDIVLCVEMDENETPSARELAEIIETVNNENISLLIAADDASKAIADVIARETDAKVIVLDPVLNGDFSPTAYTDAMNGNAHILKGSVDK